MSPSKKGSKSTSKRRSVAPSAPEVKLTYAAAGRDTLAAIDDELAAPSPGRGEAPVLEITETPAGRETMAAIEEELADAMRPRQNTLPYGDRISNAPGARSPSRAPAPPRVAAAGPAAASSAAIATAAAPAVAPIAPAAVRVTPPSRKPAVVRAPVPEADDGPEVTVSMPAPAAEPVATSVPEALEIFELLTFIVRGNQVGDLSTDALRRRFVEQHLLRRVPQGSMDAVERVEVTPWTAKGTMVVRVWCRT